MASKVARDFLALIRNLVKNAVRYDFMGISISDPTQIFQNRSLAQSSVIFFQIKPSNASIALIIVLI